MTQAFDPLPGERLVSLEGWAMLSRSMGYVYRPSTGTGISEVLKLAVRSRRSVAPRGSGFSYGDTSLNAENIVLDLSRMNRILEWDPRTGVIRVEPGVTIGQLWRYVLEDGWWPAVVPGTMYPTLGGCASTNVHGKNNWRVGTFGDHVLALELLLPSGECIRCTRELRQELFFAAIGGLGMLGIITSLTIQLEPVQSGLLRVDEYAAGSLGDMFALFQRLEPDAGHLVGWIDGFASGAALGRGLIHAAYPVSNNEERPETLRPSHQDLADTIVGVVPRSALWRAMKLGANDPGMRVLNAARYGLGVRRSGRSIFVPHAQFHFILDYMPNWKRAFQPGGIVQYQVFVPSVNACDVFAALLEESRQLKMIPHLAVFKRHRSDSFLLSYGTDGYSLALDYRVAPGSLGQVEATLSTFTEQIVLPAAGRFYPAKDSSSSRESLRQSLTPQAVDTFLDTKRRVDPDTILQSDLYRRLFVP